MTWSAVDYDAHVTSIARLALLLAALACWRGRSRSVAAAILAIVVASGLSTLPIPPRLALACYLVAPAASAWLALHVATGRGWPAVVAWVGAAAAVCLAPDPSMWWTAVPVAAHSVSVAAQLGAVAAMRRPLGRPASSALALLASDVALAIFLPSPGATWWPVQGQDVIAAVALIYLHVRP